MRDKGEMKRKRRKSPGREESPRETIGLDRERRRAAERVFDKWAVYLAFTVNEAGCDDVLSLRSLSLRPSLYEVRIFGLSAQHVQEGQLAIHCQRVGHLTEP